MSATVLETRAAPCQQGATPRTWLAATLAPVAAWRRRARARRQLLAADPRMLADLGISRAQAMFTALEGRLD